MRNRAAMTDSDDGPVFRWPARPLSTMIAFSLVVHALAGVALLLSAGNPVASAPGDAEATAVTLLHRVGIASPAINKAAATGAPHATTPATALPTPATAMRVTPLRDDAPPSTSSASGTAAASPSTATAADARRRYLAALGARLAQHRVYPAAAQRRGLEGQVMVALRIGRDGSVQSLAVHRSSGEMLLDEGALETVRRASPLPPLPENLPESTLDVELPLFFRLVPHASRND
jgi:TonB family protein